MDAFGFEWFEEVQSNDYNIGRGGGGRPASVHSSGVVEAKECISGIVLAIIEILCTTMGSFLRQRLYRASS